MSLFLCYYKTMYDVVVFRSELHPIGGIETWVINLAKRYGRSHKFAIVCGASASYNIIKRLLPHVEVMVYTGQSVKTKKAIFCYDFMGLDTCEADEVIHVVHADHSVVSLPNKIPDGIDKFVSVSEVARQGLIKMAGVDSEVVYNPTCKPEPRRLIRLVSGTRLTSEKGLPRMKQLAHALDRAGVLYEWSIFTNYGNKESFSPNVIYREPTNDLLSYVAQSDYLVQLSDTESYGYSMVEALSIGIPLVVTDIPVLPEMGITSKHAIIVPLQGADYDDVVRQITDSQFSFVYNPPKDRWDEVFGEGSGNDYVFEPLLMRNCYGEPVTLMKEDVTLQDGEVVTLFDKARARDLVERGYLEYVIQ